LSGTYRQGTSISVIRGLRNVDRGILGTGRVACLDRCSDGISGEPTEGASHLSVERWRHATARLHARQNHRAVHWAVVDELRRRYPTDWPSLLGTRFAHREA